MYWIWDWIFAAFIGATYCIFLAVWMASIWIFRLKHKVWLGLLSLPVFTVLLLGFDASVSKPSAIFTRTLGFSPTPDVEIIESSEWEGPDWHTVYLRFRASPNTVKRITSRGLRRTRPDSAERHGPIGWHPSSPPDQLYHGVFNGRNFATEEECLAYDDGTAEFWSDGSD